MPWSVLGAGAAVAALGIPFHLESQDNYRDRIESFRELLRVGSGLPAETEAKPMSVPSERTHAPEDAPEQSTQGNGI